MAKRHPTIDLAAVAANEGGFAIVGQEPFDRAGRSVAAAGDVNGDGFDDLIIGAYRANRLPVSWADARTGAAYVVFGGEQGPPGTVDLDRIAAGEGGFRILGRYGSDRVGRFVSAAGDVNGDGFDDVMVSASGVRTSGAAGAVYVVFGAAGGLPPSIGIGDLELGRGGFAIVGSAGVGVGFGIAAAGDVNRDGFDDLLIGASGEPVASANGGAFVLYGKADPFAPRLEIANLTRGDGSEGFVVFSGSRTAGLIGYSVAGGADVNGDGFDDIVLSQGSRDFGVRRLDQEGQLNLVFGSGAGFTARSNLFAFADGVSGIAMDGTDSSIAFAQVVAVAGDVNGDGIDDLVVSAVDRPDDSRKRGLGAAYVLFGRDDGKSGTIEELLAGNGDGFVIRGRPPFENVGRAVSGAGDINGDGFDDIVVTDPFADTRGDTANWTGRAFVVFGKAAGFPVEIDANDIARGRGGFMIRGEDRELLAGYSVSAAGDLNGDGFDDLVIGTIGPLSGHAASESPNGAYVVLGRGSFQAPEGSLGDDDLVGGRGAEAILGLWGDDELRGRGGDDALTGGEGRDRLRGGAGSDVLKGGEGADRFILNRAEAAAIERILDFDIAAGDRIVLTAIDAATTMPGNDAFTPVGEVAFSGVAGELRWFAEGDGHWRLEGDVDGDGLAELVIGLASATAPDPTWVLL